MPPEHPLYVATGGDSQQLFSVENEIVWVDEWFSTLQRERIMKCELSGTGEATHVVSFPSQILDLTVRVRVSTETFRAVHAKGGIDAWLLKTPKEKMCAKARRLRWEVSQFRSLRRGSG